jgi:hypothetical protein
MDDSRNAGKYADGRNDMKGRGDANRGVSGEISKVGESSGVSAARGEGENGAAEGEIEQLFRFMLGKSGDRDQAPFSDSGEEGVVGWEGYRAKAHP